MQSHTQHAQTPMEYRSLGRTGLKVSRIGFGCYMFPFETAEKVTHDTVKRALELGINFFDTAEMYASGQSEIDFGKALKKLNVKRESIVVSTKLFWSGPQPLVSKDTPGPNEWGLSRKRINEGINNSLKRLQLDYVDVLFCHRFDYDTPLEETCRAINNLIEQGKVYYWGTSEWTAQQIASAIEICDKLKLVGPVVEQPQYNMMERNRVEVELAPLYDLYGLGTTIWSPLAGGLLTGKYLKENAEGRFSTVSELRGFFNYDKLFGPENIEKTRKMFKELEEIAASLGGSLVQLALAWTLRNKDVSSALCGFTKVQQVEENVKAVEIYKKFTPEIDERIEKLLDNRPDPGMNFKSFSKLPYRR